MGALPKRKISKRRQGKRRAAIKLALEKMVPCPQCSQPKRPHRVCLHCGYYNGEKVVRIREKKSKKK